MEPDVHTGKQQDLHPRLREVFDTKQLRNSDGAEVALSSAITESNAVRLSRIVRSNKVERAVEVGMAHGVSSLSILHGMHSPNASLISMDPWQLSHWQGCGRQLLIEEGFADRHRLIKEVDWFALPDLLKSESRFDFAYIDGDHSFACTFLDLFYLDKMLDVGGVIGFNDCGMPAVQRVVSYLRANLDYEPVDEIRLSWWRKRNMRFWEYPDLYFRKSRDVTVPWDKYFDF